MKTIAITAATLAALLSGCASNINASGQIYRAGDTMRASQVAYMTVVSVRHVRIQHDQTGIGATIGAIGGAGLGSHVGGGKARRIGTLLGTIGGAVVGGRTEQAMNREDGLEIVVRDRTSTFVVVQAADMPIYPGQQVNVIRQGSNIRVAPL